MDRDPPGPVAVDRSKNQLATVLENSDFRIEPRITHTKDFLPIATQTPLINPPEGTQPATPSENAVNPEKLGIRRLKVGTVGTRPHQVKRRQDPKHTEPEIPNTSDVHHTGDEETDITVTITDIGDLVQALVVPGNLLNKLERAIASRIGRTISTQAGVNTRYGVHNNPGKTHSGTVVLCIKDQKLARDNSQSRLAMPAMLKYQSHELPTGIGGAVTYRHLRTRGVLEYTDSS